ncbi:ubiquitin family protein [Legionella sp. CNM-1927-20]|uniref:ubiquitin family protein n=1 Tax=Legionella sp. CNM-1927-20 TaxID=3422221 RepID=UPI00403B29F8
MDTTIKTYIEQFINARIIELLEASNNNYELVKDTLFYLVGTSLTGTRVLRDGYSLLKLEDSDLEKAYDDPSYISKNITNEMKNKAKNYFVSLIKAYIKNPSTNFVDVIKAAENIETHYFTENPYLFVSTLTGHKVPLEAYGCDTVEEVKQRYEVATGIPIINTSNVWRFFGKTLQDSQTLIDQNVTRGSTIHMGIKY